MFGLISTFNQTKVRLAVKINDESNSKFSLLEVATRKIYRLVSGLFGETKICTIFHKTKRSAWEKRPNNRSRHRLTDSAISVIALKSEGNRWNRESENYETIFYDDIDSIRWESNRKCQSIFSLWICNKFLLSLYINQDMSRKTYRWPQFTQNS